MTSSPASYPPPLLHHPFTSPAALAEVERFVLEATVFNSIRGGYLGSHKLDGFVPSALAAVAEEFSTAFPALLEGEID